MASGGFSTNTTDFLEEWKAKREKMRAKMLGDIAAATGACTGSVAAPASLGTTGNKSEARAAPSTELSNNNGNQDRATPTPVNCVASLDAPGSNLKKTPEKVPCGSQDSSPTAARNDREEKKGSGGGGRKGKGNLEKRKLREKRRPTGVVGLPSNESLDELDDDDGGEREKKRTEQLTQDNTFQNESMNSDPGDDHLLQETPRSSSSRYKSSAGPGSEEASGWSSRAWQDRQGRDPGAAGAPSGGLERRLEELERELAQARQENVRLVKEHQDKDHLVDKLNEEIDMLNRDLDDVEEENEQLKQENKTLLKVVDQLTR